MALTPASVRKHCLSFPGATVTLQWGNDHVFKVGGKMFAVIGIDAGKFHGLSFKTAGDSFVILTQLPGIVPAPYLARAQWVALDKLSVLPAAELKAYLRRAYDIVAAGLSKAMQRKLAAG
jgi:predicted DNA-binding protein (MmcQ/YjbR family)